VVEVLLSPHVEVVFSKSVQQNHTKGTRSRFIRFSWFIENPFLAKRCSQDRAVHGFGDLRRTIGHEQVPQVIGMYGEPITIIS
jgi:hypothetical protein